MTEDTILPMTPDSRLSRRALGKQRTRQRLLSAAKRLFIERGYDEATIRDIASAADLSTGAVFASFSDKAELFNDIIIAEYEAMAGRMAAAADSGGSAETVLLDMLTVAYRTHLDQIRLTQSVIGFSWRRTPEAEKRSRAASKLVLGELSAVLRRGVDHGELSPNLDVKLTSEMLWDSYVSNYRRAIFDDWDIEALRSRLAAQIRVLLAGYQRAA